MGVLILSLYLFKKNLITDKLFFHFGNKVVGVILLIVALFSFSEKFKTIFLDKNTFNTY